MTVGWIAERLAMGTRGYLNHFLFRRRKLGEEYPISRTAPFMLKIARHRIRCNRSSTNSSRHFRPPKGCEGLKSGIPITDACIVEKFTEPMLRKAAEVLDKSGIGHPASHPSPRLTSPLRRHTIPRLDLMCALGVSITSAMAVQLALGSNRAKIRLMLPHSPSDSWPISFRQRSQQRVQGRMSDLGYVS